MLVSVSAVSSVSCLSNIELSTFVLEFWLVGLLPASHSYQTISLHLEIESIHSVVSIF